MWRFQWVADVCGECEFCTNGQDELHCPKQTNSGFTAAGTFQQYCIASGKYTTRIPAGVKDEEAGPIMCGGGEFTLYPAPCAYRRGQETNSPFHQSRHMSPASEAPSNPVNGSCFLGQAVGWVISRSNMQKRWACGSLPSMEATRSGICARSWAQKRSLTSPPPR